MPSSKQHFIRADKLESYRLASKVGAGPRGGRTCASDAESRKRLAEATRLVRRLGNERQAREQARRAKEERQQVAAKCEMERKRMAEVECEQRYLEEEAADRERRAAQLDEQRQARRVMLQRTLEPAKRPRCKPLLHERLEARFQAQEHKEDLRRQKLLRLRSEANKKPTLEEIKHHIEGRGEKGTFVKHNLQRSLRQRVSRELEEQRTGHARTKEVAREMRNIRVSYKAPPVIRTQPRPLPDEEAASNTSPRRALLLSDCGFRFPRPPAPAVAVAPRKASPRIKNIQSVSEVAEKNLKIRLERLHQLRAREHAS